MLRENQVPGYVNLSPLPNKAGFIHMSGYLDKFVAAHSVA